ncbi:transporter substrate-binding domain-containing protein [Micromonospora fulviviridis]|uniref:Transporter substrate-binding domain-containing protein n=1 Tax=Micromonospora fulviviridis TaxID=47860 RepID=A0ABV2VT01_9ACTN
MRRTLKGQLFAGALLVVVASGLTACTSTGANPDGDAIHLVQAGKLTTCTHLPYPPFQSRDGSGKVVGFDVDLVDLVAQRLGVAQAIVDTPFEGIKSGADLNAGKCDTPPPA